MSARAKVDHGTTLREIYHQGKLVAEITLDDSGQIWLHQFHKRRTLWFEMASMDAALKMSELWDGPVIQPQP